MIRFLSKSKRVIEVPDWDTNLIRIYTLSGFPVIGELEAEEFVEKEKKIVEKEKATFDFYPPYETLLVLALKEEPSGIQDEEELAIIVKKIPGYESMVEEEFLECFLYMKKREDWLKNATHN